MPETVVRADAASHVALLLACADTMPDVAEPARVRALAAHVTDWPALIALAHRHRMMPLLHAHVGMHAADLVPVAVLEELHDYFVANAARNLMLSAELHEVLALLGANGIRVLPYKGPGLAQCVYGNITYRTMKDLDLLVEPGDLVRVAALLRTRGYKAPPAVLCAPLFRGFEYQYALWRPGDEAMIELHWTIVPRTIARPLGIDDFWDSRIDVSVLQRPLPNPSHEDTLLILAIHGAKHRWERLEWICGLAQLIHSKPLDWYRMLDRAAGWRCARMVRTGLLLAHGWLGAPVPALVLTEARADRHAAALADEAAHLLFAQPNATRATGLRHFQLRLQESVADRARHVAYRCMIAGARQAARLAARLAPGVPA
ncbi:MAG: nucleotidyltransferase family protein [Gemmatimonadaceae bacterium]